MERRNSREEGGDFPREAAQTRPGRRRVTGMTFAELARNWSAYVGAAIATIARPVAFVPASGALHLRVVSGAWKREVDSLRPSSCGPSPTPSTASLSGVSHFTNQ